MFVHLHTRSWFSFLQGGSSPEALVRRARQLGQPALALTDVNGVYGAVRFQQACKRHGIHPIIGAELYCEGFPLVLLARSRAGYARLCALITQLHRSTESPPSVPLEALREHAVDLLCLTGGRDGRLWSLISRNACVAARRWLEALQHIFSGTLYVELVNGLHADELRLAKRLNRLAVAQGLPTVATNDVRFATPEEYRRYDLLTCIRLGIPLSTPHGARPGNAEAYLKSAAQMERLLPFAAARRRTGEIASRCHVELVAAAVDPPAARVPDSCTPGRYLRDLCREAMKCKYGAKVLTRASRQLERELEIIGDLHLDEFFLIVREVVMEARSRNIRCAGRGSAANSIVAFLLDITSVDPLEHELLFERFLHRGRKGTPDIDVDFDSERRQEIIDWIQTRFGAAHTAMTATVITYRLRLALRDVTRAFGYPMKIVNQVSRVVPGHYEPGHVRDFRQDLEAILGNAPALELILDMVEELAGCPRHLGLHNGGMVLSRQTLHHFSPVQTSANGVRMVQFDKGDVEALGLIKLDVLGLRMLAAISESVELIQRHHGQLVDMEQLPLDDEQVYAFIRTGRTLGLFQIESMGQMHLVASHQPRVFDDLVCQVALFRPGPLQGGMVHPFIRRRQGREAVRYDHEDLEPILRGTCGIILFQEQILEIAHRFAGMSLEDADDFRRIMSRSRSAEQMEDMRGRFVGGAVARGVPTAVAHQVFAQLANFVGYGFCRSHAAAFARTVYHSAWLKCYYPDAFLAAIMQHRPGMYSLLTLEEEARRCGVDVLPPDINRSGVRYVLEPERLEAAPPGISISADAPPVTTISASTTPDTATPAAATTPVAATSDTAMPEVATPAAATSAVATLKAAAPTAAASDTVILEATTPYKRDKRGKYAIRKPLSVIKGVSKEMARRLIWARREGPFRDVEDLLQRVAVPRQVLDALARSGALDAISASSRQALWTGGVLARRLETAVQAPSPPLWQVPMLGVGDVPQLPELTSTERLVWDLQTHEAARIHPLALLRRELDDLSVQAIGSCYLLQVAEGEPPVSVVVAGITMLKQKPGTAKGMMFATLEDETGFIQCIISPPVQERCRTAIRAPAVLVQGLLQGKGSWRAIMVEAVFALSGISGGTSGFPCAAGRDHLHIADPADVVEIPTPAARPTEYMPTEGTVAEAARRRPDHVAGSAG